MLGLKSGRYSASHSKRPPFHLRGWGGGGQALSEGWSAEVSRHSGRPYYFYKDAEREHTQFEHPGFASDAGATTPGASADATPDGAATTVGASVRTALLLRTQMLSAGRGVVPPLPRERVRLLAGSSAGTTSYDSLGPESMLAAS